MKILINALSGNGDALMFSPALRLLKEKISGASVDMLVMFKSVKEMYEQSPFLEEIHFINFLRQSRLKSLADVRRIKNNNYDYSINVYPSNRLEYNLVNAFLGAKKKIAHHYIHSGLSRAEFFNDILIDEVKDRHNVLQNLDLLKPIVTDVKDEEAGKMEIFISDEDITKANVWITENGIRDRLLIGFHPGSSILKNHIHKRWDKYKYAELGKRLMKEYSAKILLFGNEFELNEEIKSLMNNEAIISSTHNYMDSVARMKHCKLFVSNDTAFMHSSAALQIPTVAIFAYTNYKELYPWKVDHATVRKELTCSPCFYNSPKPVDCIWNGEDEYKCIKTISVDEVFKACKKLLEK